MLFAATTPARADWPKDAIVRWSWNPDAAPTEVSEALRDGVTGVCSALPDRRGWLGTLRDASAEAHEGCFLGVAADGAPAWVLRPVSAAGSPGWPPENASSPAARSIAALRAEADRRSAAARVVLEIAVDLNQLRRAHDEWVDDGVGAALLEACRLRNGRDLLLRVTWTSDVIAARPDGRAIRRPIDVPDGLLVCDLYFSMRSESIGTVHHHQLATPFWPTSLAGAPPETGAAVRIDASRLFDGVALIDAARDHPTIPSAWSDRHRGSLRRALSSFDGFAIVIPDADGLAIRLQARGGVRQRRLSADAERLLGDLEWPEVGTGWRSPSGLISCEPLEIERARGRAGLAFRVRLPAP